MGTKLIKIKKNGRSLKITPNNKDKYLKDGWEVVGEKVTKKKDV